MNRFTFALFHFYTLRLLNWDVWKNYQNIYFRIIIIVSFLRMQCAFWQRGWPLGLLKSVLKLQRLEYMWLLTVLLSGLMNCFKSELQEAQVFTSHMNFLSWQSQVQIFWGFTVSFLAIGLLTVSYNSSFWDFRLIWVTFENSSEKMTKCIYVLLTWRSEKKPLGSHYFAL